MAENLVFILGDQLSKSVSSLQNANKKHDRVLMVEVAEEAAYVPHHKKKIAFIFSAMRHFAEELRGDGWLVDYVELDDPENTGSFGAELARAIANNNPGKIIITEAGEWRVMQDIKSWEKKLGITVDVLADDRFITSHGEFTSWAEGRKQLRMEYFYRDVRRKTGLLIKNGEPEGGKWNYDSENRKPANNDLFMPSVMRFAPDEITIKVLELVDSRFAGNFGDLMPFWFAVTSDQAQEVLDHFIENALASFGDYQDAMLLGQPFLYHSLISLYMNIGLLNPLTVCEQVEAAYYAGKAPLNAVEGYIRQIVGWREYVRGIYWLKMPDYLEQDYFENTRALPEFYWSGQTDMACLRSAITQTREEAYAHHIQRLMITGNFALLIGVQPKEIHEWYLAVYADAYEWVELPNTLGMSQFADGGMLGSKPYAASGNYINKMSDYCKSCRYDVKQKVGPDACPFNALYWHFMARNKDKLNGNARLGQVYRTWDKMGKTKQNEYLASAHAFLDTLD